MQINNHPFLWKGDYFFNNIFYQGIFSIILRYNSIQGQGGEKYEKTIFVNHIIDIAFYQLALLSRTVLLKINPKSRIMFPRYRIIPQIPDNNPKDLFIVLSLMARK
jgi:hypothetical protein